APLVQNWFSLARPGSSPWRLYALSNFGSFLALLSYPFAVEPYFRLRTQAWIWSGMYVVFGALCIWDARVAPYRTATVRERTSADVFSSLPHPAVATILLWLGLSAAGSTLLLAVTNEISQEIAVVPFLWIAPLAVYLLTFVITFDRER